MIPTAVPRFMGCAMTSESFASASSSAVVPLMGTRDYEYLPIRGKEWIQTSACLTQQALRTDNRAELLRAIVSRDPKGQVSQPWPHRRQPIARPTNAEASAELAPKCSTSSVILPLASPWTQTGLPDKGHTNHQSGSFDKL